jgi:hypothetical protein
MAETSDDKKFQTITTRDGMSEDGRKWLVLALDPFHDYNVGLAGMPDHDTGATAIQFIRGKRTITRPINLGVGELWDAHITTMPWQETFQCRGLSGACNNRDHRYVAAQDDEQLGTLSYVTHETNSVGFPNGSWVVDTKREFYGISPTDDNSNSMHKIIGGGFEVHNDTPELTRSGNVAVYTAPQSVAQSIKYVSHDAGTTEFFQDSLVCRQPPAKVTDAALYPETRNWTAAQGCYVPFRLNLAQGSEFHPMKVATPVVLRQDDTEGTVVYGMMAKSDTVGANASGMALPGISTTGSAGFHESGLNTTGAYFSGLSRETVLTLDYLFIVEMAPTAANKAMLAMTSPTALYDPVALREYCNIVSRLPPGVPVAMNTKGSWFRGIMKTAAQVAHVAAPIAAIAGQPAIASAVYAGGSVANVLSKKPKKGKAPTVGASRTGARNDLRK